MSLIFNAFVPHPPIIIPSVGKKNTDQVKTTIAALAELEGDLYVSQPDVIFIISPHSLITPEAFSINLANEFKSNLSEFNATEKEMTFKCDIELISEIKEHADQLEIPVNIINQPILDHGVCVPLYYLTQHLPKIKIVPISYSMLNLDKHMGFGLLLKKISSLSNKRIAIIASGDLSHRLTKDAPAGYSPDGETFDRLLLDLLEKNKFKEIPKINLQLIEEAGECGFRSLMILLGALSEINCCFKKLSYEKPFGVGYLVGEFIC